MCVDVGAVASGGLSDALAVDVRHAMTAGVHLLLAHEMEGGEEQHRRHGCDFSLFFANERGQTPTDLLQRGIYSEIAVPLKASHWRAASMVMLANALANVGVDEKADEEHRTYIEAQVLTGLVNRLSSAGRVTLSATKRVTALVTRRSSTSSTESRFSERGSARYPGQSHTASAGKAERLAVDAAPMAASSVDSVHASAAQAEAVELGVVLTPPQLEHAPPGPPQAPP